MSNRALDIVIYGATGFTGRLIAEYLSAKYGTNDGVRWAIAGRSPEKLAAVHDELGLSADVAVLVADSTDANSLAAMVEQARVVLTTAGPYQLYGSDLLAACARAGTDYVDLCGEPVWMHEMIAAHSETARASGAHIVFSCGFDSIPFDLGVYYLQQQAIDSLGAPLKRIKGRVRGLSGTFSGGTQATFAAVQARVAENPKLAAVLKDPFALTDGFQGPEQPSGTKPEYDESLEVWATPFVMATINTKNIHRSNSLLNHRYGKDFVYDEMLLTGPGEQGEALAKNLAKKNVVTVVPRQPGEGPDRQEREAGYYDILFLGETADGQTVSANVKGDMDPGYGSTAKMVAECAICLLQKRNSIAAGIWTPAAALGDDLIRRLEQNAGLTFHCDLSNS